MNKSPITPELQYLTANKARIHALAESILGPEWLRPFGEPCPGFSTPFLLQDSFQVTSSSPTTINAVTMSTGFPSYALTNPGNPTLYGAVLNLRTPYFQHGM